MYLVLLPVQITQVPPLPEMALGRRSGPLPGMHLKNPICTWCNLTSFSSHKKAAGRITDELAYSDFATRGGGEEGEKP